MQLSVEDAMLGSVGMEGNMLKVQGTETDVSEGTLRTNVGEGVSDLVRLDHFDGAAFFTMSPHRSSTGGSGGAGHSEFRDLSALTGWQITLASDMETDDRRRSYATASQRLA